MAALHGAEAPGTGDGWAWYSTWMDISQASLSTCHSFSQTGSYALARPCESKCHKIITRKRSTAGLWVPSPLGSESHHTSGCFWKHKETAWFGRWGQFKTISIFLNEEPMRLMYTQSVIIMCHDCAELITLSECWPSSCPPWFWPDLPLWSVSLYEQNRIRLTRHLEEEIQKCIKNQQLIHGYKTD